MRFYRDPMLRVVCHPVMAFDRDIQDLALNMVSTMRAYGGIGLAAPQIGIPLRFFVVDTGEQVVMVANPEIEASEGSTRMEEGCLSLPEIRVDIERSLRVMLKGWSADGKEWSREFVDLSARVIQHEIDHLNGVLIIDHARCVQRTLLRHRIKRLERQQSRNPRPFAPNRVTHGGLRA